MNKEDYQKLMEQAKKVTITSVMDEQGMDYIDMRNFAQSVEHDSLMIDKRKNRFYWNSQIEDGKVVSGDTIDFVKRFFNKSHMEALTYLAEEEHEKLTTQEKMAKPKEPFQYYFQHANTFQEARNYLVNERKISPVLVDTLHKKGFIQQDKYNQCVFVWSDTGKAVGASIIGSEYNPEKYGKRGRFKGIARNSESNFGFNVTLGTPNRLYIFESPVDLLSYWTMNPQLKNCMLAEMEGLKEQSVYKFMNNMIVSKGATPYEGIYLGIDNDPAGQRFFDNLSKLSYTDKEGRDVEFKRCVAHDLDIPKANIPIYSEAANQYQVDWRMIAATHKALTNFSPEGKTANAWDVQEFFSGEDFDLTLESQRVAQKLSEIELAPQQYDIPRLFQVQEGLDPIKLRGLHRKVSTYYEDYQNLGYRPTDALVKDWNDALQYQVFTLQEARLLEAVYQRNNEEEMKIIKDEQTKKYKALSLSQRQFEPFFEADSPAEAAMLVKNYGFQAVDKEDRQKYQTKRSPESKKETAWAMSR